MNLNRDARKKNTPKIILCERERERITMQRMEERITNL